MRSRNKLASVAFGGMTILLCLSTVSIAQGVDGRTPPAPAATGAAGTVAGVVSDEKGEPIASVVVSAVGSVAAFAVTDDGGRFEFRGLPPGAYQVRARSTGYLSRGSAPLNVRSDERVSLALSLARDPDAAPILAAGLGAPNSQPVVKESEPGANGQDAAGPESADRDGESETAWRLRHARRSVLKDATIPADLFASSSQPSLRAPFDYATRAAETSVRMATNFLTDTAFSGEVNLLTTGLFESPRDLFSSSLMSRGIAYVSLSAPAGDKADWTVRGAFTQADISAWIVAGSYATRDDAPHQRSFGVSYSTQRYDGGNPLALSEVTDGSRNVGEIYGFDTVDVVPGVSLTYGADYAQYDYLQRRNLISPRVELLVEPSRNLQFSGRVSRRALAPGAEEFLPPSDTGIWLPPQRTFSALEPGRPLTAEHTLNAEVGVKRRLGAATVGVRGFHQRVDDQLMTLFGADIPDLPAATLGHYFVGSAGDAKATGGAVSVEGELAGRVNASVEYSVASARLRLADDLQYVVFMAPSTGQPYAERIHDVSARLEARVPETSTSVLLLYRVGNAFAHGTQNLEGTATRRGIDSRFDVQVRQSLPFMDFRTARWEMLVAVRNFFRETALDQSIYDELLVVRPPKRIVGGLTMLF
jgi:hypothetical protein